MTGRTILFGLGIAAALASGVAFADDPTERLLLERAQRADAFTLGVQQSMESGRAGKLGARERLELDARQREQRQAQDALFYRQRIQTYAPASGSERRVEMMRAEQEREEQLSRFRFEAASPSRGESAAPLSPLAPAIVTAPIPRAPADPARVAAMPDAKTAAPELLAQIRRVEHDADTLWQAALARDWNAAQDALASIRGSVEALRSDRFRAEYAASGGRVDLLAAVLVGLDSGISSAETQLGAGDGASAMRLANALMLTAAELVPDITAARARRSITRN